MSDPQDPFKPLPDVQPPQAQPSFQPPQQPPPPQQFAQPPYGTPPPMPYSPMMLGVQDGSAIRAQGTKMMVIGAVLAVVGIVITAATYSSASSGGGGGTYFVAYGPIIFGVIRFFQGIAKYASAPA
jgi:hypothetical protein